MQKVLKRGISICIISDISNSLSFGGSERERERGTAKPGRKREV